MSERSDLTGRSRRVVLGVMCAGYFLVLLDVTIVNVALPGIGNGLGVSVGGLQWVVDGYALALAALMLGGGTIGDLYGHKRVVLAGLALFGVASVGCGLAPSAAVLVVFRVVQGAGAALMLPGTLAVISQAFPGDREKARAIGIWAGVGSAALPAGPLLGGLLTDGISWRMVFLINVPIVVGALIATARVVRESRDGSGATGRRLDLPGLFLGGAVLAAATFAFIEAGQVGLSPPVTVAIVAAVLLLAAFLLVEGTRPDPMLPLGLFRSRIFSTANAVAGVMNLTTLGLLFVLTLYLQDARHDSAVIAGLALFPLFLPLSVLAPLAGRLTGRIGARWPMTAGLILAAAGIGSLGVLTADSSYAALLPGLLLWGIGLGVLTPAVVSAAIGAVPPERAGLASAVNNTARQACGAVGIAAFGALAGDPNGVYFLSGFHTAALLGAGLFVLGAAATVIVIRRPRAELTT